MDQERNKAGKNRTCVFAADWVCRDAFQLAARLKEKTELRRFVATKLMPVDLVTLRLRPKSGQEILHSAKLG